MWKKLSKHFALLVICLLMFIFVIFPYGLSRLFRRLTLNAYLNNEYHLLCDEMKIKYIGNNAHANIRGVHGDRHRWWISAYEIGIPFMSKTFEIWIDKRSNSIYGSNFYEVLSTDLKFQHLYSEWVKKQVGISGENVELEFDRAIISSRLIGGDIYIDFSKITSLDNLEDQICMNTKNYYLKSIDVKMVDVNIEEKWLNKAKNIKDEYVNVISNIMPSLILNDKIIVKLYYYDVDLVFDRYNQIKTNKNDKNFYYIQFDLYNNKIKYLSNYYDSTWGTVLDNWLTEIEYD